MVFPTFSANCVVQWLIHCKSVFRCLGMQLQCLRCLVLLLFSYYRLINLKYDNCTTKTAMANRLAVDKAISVREVERWLDANAYLEEYWWWVLSRPHQEFLHHQMFLHATATGRSECDHAICWDRRTLSVVWDLRVECTAMELISPDSPQEEIAELYQDVYPLQQLPRGSHCEEGMEEHLCQEVLDSNKECLWHKRPSTLPEAEQKWRLADVHRPDPRLSLLPHTMPHMSSLPPHNRIHAKKLWPSQDMPVSVPWQLQLYWRRK